MYSPKGKEETFKFFFYGKFEYFSQFCSFSIFIVTTKRNAKKKVFSFSVSSGTIVPSYFDI
jgi:hypothetical protein